MVDALTLIEAARAARERAVQPTRSSKWCRAGGRGRHHHHRLQHRELDLRAHGVRRAGGPAQGGLRRPPRLPAHRRVADTADPTPPCGPCRQLLWEFCGDIEVILANRTADMGHHRLKDLLPRSRSTRACSLMSASGVRSQNPAFCGFET